jgi:signal transduction histidine kinase
MCLRLQAIRVREGGDYVVKFINNINIRTKLTIFVSSIFILIIAIVATFLCSAYRSEQNGLQLIEQTIRNSYDSNIKKQVDNTITLLEGIYKKYESGELTLEEAKALGADLIRTLRYDDNGYFWIDTTEGINVVLLGSDTEGTDRYNIVILKALLL